MAGEGVTIVWTASRLVPAMTAGLGGGTVAAIELGSWGGAAALDEPVATGAADAAMERYALGDDASFEPLYDALATRLYRYLRRHVPDAHRADDLLQETFLRMHKARGTFLMGAAVLPWAFAIARRLVLDEVRRDRRAPRVVDDSDPVSSSPAVSTERPEQLVEAREFAQRFADTLARLPESQRTTFELLKQDGLTLAEAAAVLGVTVTAVKLRAHRAYESLRIALGDGVGSFPGKVRS
jgi:RNA polymerase sigma-70 factor (ECF subfamily)